MRAVAPLPAVRSLPSLVLAGALAAALGACGSSGGGGSSFAINTTTRAAAPSAPIVVVGDWLVYFASEGLTGPAGTDLNGDGDTADQVAIAVNTRSRTETNLMVAASGAAIVGDEIYLAADEAAGNVDWGGAVGTTDHVLLHWSEVAAAVTFVDVLDDAADALVALDDHLYYAADATPAGDDTNLRALAEVAPTTPVTVQNTATGGPLLVHLIREIRGLVFCRIDETEDGTDRNGDGNADDPYVLALLDGTDPAARLKSVGLAMADEDSPLDARLLAAGNWLVAFLVDEASQGENLNDQALFTQPLLPENCVGTPDGDQLDEVLHFLEFDDFVTGAADPVNTGIAGHLRVIAIDGFVATISDEDEANCNLNSLTGDTDTDDDVARWVATVLPIAPHVAREDMHALATGISGGSFGLAALDDRLVAVIDEAADDKDYDGVPGTDFELVAWIDPSASTPAWDFSHSSTNPNHGTGIPGEPFAGTGWMAPEQVGDRLPLVFLEEVPATNPSVGSLNTNVDCAFVAKDSDKTDGLPVWADFEAGPTLDFDGVGFAVDKANAGMEVAQGFAFFRVSESEDNRDYNADGDKSDVVLFRNPLTTCGPVPMATSSLLAGPVIVTDRVRSAAFLSSETQAGEDFNDDGDMSDLVVRYFRF